MKKGEKERVSHANKSDVQALRDKAVKPNSWKDRPFLGQKQIDPPPKHSSKENDMPSITDPFSNIRIVNPKVSSLDMKMKMQDRKLFKLSTLNTRPSADLQGNWVTIGVVIYKSEPRTSASGKNYCLWKLSDLQNCDQVITFFLFGEVYKQHWKNEVSTVVGLLNPNPMDKAEKASKDVAFTVNHPHQILVMGHSKDLGKCAGTNRAGNACTNIINKQHGEFCTYHVQAAYKRSSSKRTELQGGAAVTPKNHVYNQKKNQQGFFFYGGETFTNMRPVSSNSSNLVTVKNLQAKQAAMGKGKLTTMSLHNIAASDNKRLQQLQDKDNALVDLLSTPTVGSMNMIKHLMKKENMEKDQQDDKKKPAIQSISARDLLRQHKEVMRQKLRPSSTGSTPPVNPLKVAPVLGKGCNDGLINLDAPRVPKLSAMKAEQAKRKAILQIQEKGGIQKEDPNAVRKKSSPEARERILKRIREDVDQENKSKSAEEPPKKKSKLLGNIDENSEEFKALMKTKSRHTGALKEAEKEIEEKYFMELEKKERYEEKMSSIMEMKCTVFTCKICNYTSFKTSDRCKEERHPITKVQATKRFFKCKKCGKRTHSIHKLPQEPCRGCGDNNYERTSMLQERKGPKLPHENLCIRGDEAKFLNSMDQKSYLNL
ncbi:hypothetical protein FSP39_024878 [Pinctada imbricata]|uniref:Protein MCM10 homolog n=1 Tax=Pinctada imbricata TaxID=66713 RepID=A0AA88YG67_PINIB|nr:hypothetical protein FSP39_024878 [Pinctada imbricata]